MSALAVLYKPTLANQDDPGTILATRIAAAAITAGQGVYDDANGKAQVADAATSGKQQISGLAVYQDKAAGQACTIVRRGLVVGFDLSGIAFGSLIYLDTAGNLSATANATKTVPVGKVVPTARTDSTGAIQPALDVFINPLVNY